MREIKSWTDVKLEIACKSFRFDVAVVDSSDVVYGFEVFHRHKVPEEKARNIKIKWMELVAEDILAFKPRIPVGYEYSKIPCSDCIELQQYLTEREPDDQIRRKTTEDYVHAAQKLQSTWLDIIEDAKRMDRESQNWLLCLQMERFKNSKVRVIGIPSQANNENPAGVIHALASVDPSAKHHRLFPQRLS